MIRILFASTALVMTAGVAAAEVTVGGNGRMGIHYGPTAEFVTVTDPVTGISTTTLEATGDSGWNFTSRIRIVFTASGETDGGLTFGGTIRADNAVGGARGNGGNVYISGSFGKLSMGDVNSAGEAAVGDLSAVGLTALGDFNEFGYLGGGSSDHDPVMLYEYSAGDLTFYASLTDGEGSTGGFGIGEHGPNVQTYGVGVAYTMGNFSVGAAYEAADVEDVNPTQIALGGTASFGDATVKAVYIMNSFEGDDDLEIDEWGLGVDYVFGATTVTAFYRGLGEDFSDVDAFYGLGAAYDLGGGASLKGGVVGCSSDLDESICDDPWADFGVNMTF